MKRFLVFLFVAIFVLGLTAAAYAADPSEDTPFTYVETPANTPPGAEYNAATPTGFGEPGFPADWVLSGASQWAYKDTSDATRKLEGSYRGFDNQGLNLYDSDAAGRDKGPHGGYTTTTNKCKTCHAVHRANGAFALLRVDSADDACSYCHIGDHRHSVVSAYWQSGGNINASNGHTIGAGKKIPDSSVWQWLDTKVLTSVAEGEDAASNYAVSDPTLEENPTTNNPTVNASWSKAAVDRTITIRRYDTRRNKIMRYTVHGNRWIRVGPTYLRCASCHQVHNASRQTWKPLKSTATVPIDVNDSTDVWTDGYKLLRNSPSGGITVNSADLVGGQLPASPGAGTRAYSKINFTWFDPGAAGYTNAGITGGNTGDYRIKAVDANYTGQGVTNGVVTDMSAGAGDPNMTGYTRWRYMGDGLGYSSFDNLVRVEEASMAFWCADCHNLNIAGKDKVPNNWGTGKFNNSMLSDRSHAVPMNIRAGSGTANGSQCYSCHNNDMPYVSTQGTYVPQTHTVAASGNDGAGSVTFATAPGCGNCHINSAMYRAYKQTYRTYAGVAGGNSLSDWPHAGPSDGYKLLNAVTGLGWTDNPANPNEPYDYRTPFRPATDGLDKVCKICHGPEQPREVGVDK